MDMSLTTSVCRRIGTFELNLYRVLGMSAFYALSYARRPSRILRTVRNVSAGRSETVLEQRLIEYAQHAKWYSASAGGAVLRSAP